MRRLRNNVVILTGGASGIGAAICERFREVGAKVAVFDAHSDPYKVDISDQVQVNDAVAAVERDLGPVDVLVNNAGWDKAAPFLETDAAFWQKLIAINLTGPLNMHYAVLKGMKERRLCQPGDLPGAMRFLASDDAAFITGQVLSVSGGLKMAG